MKLIRIELSSTNGKRFYVDRSYEEGVSDVDNCDKALKELSAAIEEGKSIAMMAMDEGQYGDKRFENSKPAILNTKTIEFVIIQNVGVYSVEPKQQDASEPITEVIDESPTN